MRLSAHQPSRIDSHFLGGGGETIALSRWMPREAPRGVVQLAHGMGEHIGRYAATAEFLAGNGLVVIGNDHRGHGRTAQLTGSFGDFGPGGFSAVIDDMRLLTRLGRKWFSGVPLFLLGHSMGSFAAQKLALESSENFAGLILSGTSALDLVAETIGKNGQSLELKVDASKPARTPFDWLSRDANEVDRFVADPLCFEKLAPSSALSVLSYAADLANPNRLSAIRHDLPIYLFSGSEDPIGGLSKGPRLLAERYRDAAMERVDLRLYPGGRHEMLNEINRREVRDDLLSWINQLI